MTRLSLESFRKACEGQIICIEFAPSLWTGLRIAPARQSNLPEWPRETNFLQVT